MQTRSFYLQLEIDLPPVLEKWQREVLIFSLSYGSKEFYLFRLENDMMFCIV
ncbi:hypothetical protein AtDm6_2785 [Acetobacter tropicalis]|uniref:Uncharacterized protein n=1 Tax=Acetobacter tropicalis TaxID=104102 RepID=A0A094YJF1_9PROT|nr:hypothetical protein AtDm6_2785 [Acetobacter tropicalis]